MVLIKISIAQIVYKMTPLASCGNTAMSSVKGE